MSEVLGSEVLSCTMMLGAGDADHILVNELPLWQRDFIVQKGALVFSWVKSTKRWKQTASNLYDQNTCLQYMYIPESFQSQKT